MDSKGRERPPAKILTDHFTQIEKVGNQSNRWYYQCNYCGPDGKGSRIENWDNKALKHLLVNQDCPNCPQSVHNIVRTHLDSKSVNVFLAEPITASGEAKNESTTGKPRTGGGSSSGSVKAVKRPRTLMGFADTTLTTTQQDRANFKLFRLAFISKHGHIKRNTHLHRKSDSLFMQIYHCQQWKTGTSTALWMKFGHPTISHPVMCLRTQLRMRSCAGYR